MLNKIVSLGYIFIVNQIEVFHLFQVYVPTTGFVSTLASVATIGTLGLYFFLLTFKVLVPVTYFALSFSFWFKTVSVGLTAATFVYFSIAFWSLYGVEQYLFVLQKNFYWLLYLVHGEVRTLGFLLELTMVTVQPIFSLKLLDSGDISFSSDQPYQERAKQLFDLTLQPLKIICGCISEKVEKFFDNYQAYQKQEQPPPASPPPPPPQQQVVVVEEIKNETASSCFLFEMEMQNVFGNQQQLPMCIENEDIDFVHVVPLHALGGLLLLGLRCLMKK
jgi:hypothetical protein